MNGKDHPISGVSNLAELLLWRARHQTRRVAFRFLSGASKSLTYGQLDERARLISAYLMRTCKPQEKVILFYPPGLEYVCAFMGCLYAGMVAVPLYPPRPNQKLYRAGKVIEDCGAELALTDKATMAVLSRFLEVNSQLKLALTCSETLSSEDFSGAPLPEKKPEDLAFLQYTSGSTGTPKGVMVTHGSLMANELTIATGFQTLPEDVCVSWLPLYHDMGLIGGVLQALYQGFPSFLLAPVDFVRDPISWLELISTHRATISGAPDFAYRLCIDRITPERLAALDLSRWRIAFNGAEPVQAQTLQRFAQTFAKAGFKPEAFFPCYGMAEATLFISGVDPLKAPVIGFFDKEKLSLNQAVPVTENGLAMVSCGSPTLQDRVLIVDPETRKECDACHIGEIWVSGPGVTAGYWGNETLTGETFRAFTLTGAGPFLRTGDLGFQSPEGLFVTGRLKDLIILRGRNHYPQDIEMTAVRSHPALQVDAAAAFAVRGDGEERLALVLEIRRDQVRKLDAEAVMAAVRAAISEHHEVQVHSLLLVKPGRVPKTSSGKVQRRATRELFETGQLEFLAGDHGNTISPIVLPQLPPGAELLTRADAPDLVAQWLQLALALALKIAPERIRPEQSINELGLDSMASVTLQHDLEGETGVRLPLRLLLEGRSILELAAETVSRLGRKERVEQVEQTGVFPLTPNQRALWFLYNLAPESAAYNISFALRLKSAVDVEAMAEVFSTLVQRHGQLRAVITDRDGIPSQRILVEAPLDWEHLDLSQLQPEQIRDRLEQIANSPFRLEERPALRLRLFQLAEDDFILLFCQHHLFSDYWSILVLMDEVRLLYGARHQRITLEPLRADYGHHVAALQTLVAGEEGRELWLWWKQKLAGSLPVLDLPTDRTRPLRQSWKGSVYKFNFDRDLSRQLEKLATENQITLFHLLLSLYQLLLFRYTGQDDLIVGVPTMGRNRSAWKGVAGYFVNPVPIRCQLDPNQTFLHFLSCTRQEALDAVSNGDLPFQTLVERLQPDRDGSRSPLFQTMFAFQNPHLLPESAPFALDLPGSRLQLGELEVESYPLEHRFAQFELTLFAVQGPEGFGFSLEFNTDLYERSTIQTLSRHFQNLASSAVANPAQRARDLAILGTEELQQLLGQFNGPETPNAFQAVSHTFEAHVLAEPAAVAVVEGTRSFSRSQVLARAQAVASWLSGLGIGPEDRVGILCHRNPFLVFARLGVLQTGAALVALDPNYPDERLAYMVADSGMRALLTTSDLAHRLSPGDLPGLYLDHHPTSDSSAGFTPPQIFPEQTAYMIYTSGSTGQPKAVSVPHRGLANLCDWHVRTFALEGRDRVALTAGVAFDASIWETMPCLVSGSALYIPPPETLAYPENLRDWLCDQSIAVTFLATPLAEAILNLSWPDSSLRFLLTGGDKLHHNPGQNLPFVLVNNYGPTENSVVATSVSLSDALARFQTPPIGHSISGVDSYVLGRFLEVVPRGATGELYLGGLGLARGYFGKPGLTAERFIPNPFGTEGERLYRTGDLVIMDRVAEPALFHFLGRADFQVKLRGFRVELGEIESALLQHGEIRDAAVILREIRSGDRRIVAYVVAHPALDRNRLREELGQRLPVYMVPSVFVLLDALPLTPNGKIDRKALPAPARSDLSDSHLFVAARNENEQILCRIWAQVLNVAQVGIHDNFFELGGDSILSIQVISRCRQEGLNLSPADLFQHQTIAELAQVAGSVPQISIEPASGKLTLLPIHHWFFELNLQKPNHFNQSVLLEVADSRETHILEQATASVVAHHDSFRLLFPPGEDACYDHGGFGFEVYHLEESEDLAETVLDITTEIQQGLDLDEGPVVRGAFLSTPAGQPNLFFLTAHHLVIDGVSWRILLEDISSACHQLETGPQVKLPPRTHSVSSWGEGLKALTPKVEPWLDWATKHFKSLPVDFSENGRGTGRVLVKVEGIQQRIQAANRAWNTGVDEFLLAVLVQTLAAFSRQEEFLIETEGHGRQALDLDVSRTVGWFTSKYPICLKYEQDLEKQIPLLKESLRNLPGSGIDFGLARYSGDAETRKNLARLKAQILFNYLGRFDGLLGGVFTRKSELKTGADVAPQNRIGYLFQIDAMFQDQDLHLVWTYSRDSFHQETVQKLAGDFRGKLFNLVEHCLDRHHGGITPSDFPLAGLGWAELEQIRTDRDIEDIYPLSPMQEGMLFHRLYHPESHGYHEQLTCVLEGTLDLAAFQRAWQWALDYYPALRAVYRWEGLSRPLQVILKGLCPEWLEQDLSQESSQTLILEEYQEQERARGFDLSSGPLMRFAIFRLNEFRQQFVWSYHHLLMDGWSLAIVLDSVFNRYRHLTGGKTAAVQPVQRYRDYIQWLETRSDQEAEPWWRQQLGDYSGAPVLPMDRGVSRENGRTLMPHCGLSIQAMNTLQEFARHQHLTLNTLVQAAWSLVLAGYCHTREAVFGITLSGRPTDLPGVGEMVGLFINSIPVRVNLPQAGTLLEWLKQLQEIGAEREKFGFTGLNRIQSWSRVPKNGNLFDSLLVFENYPLDAEQLRQTLGLEISDITSHARTDIPLTLVAEPHHGLRLRMIHDAGRFSESSIRRMLTHLKNLLLAIPENLHTAPCDLRMMDEAERQTLLYQWNQVPEGLAVESDIVERFARSVRLNPDNIAVNLPGSGALTYGELDRRSNQLAHRLIRAGVGGETLVGLHVNRSLEMIVGILGILKAGGAYVPMDPIYPQDRLSFIIQDAATPVLLTETSLDGGLSGAETQTLCLDQAQVYADMPESSPETLIFAQQTAYIIYTSGSTGKPKGVPIPHNNVVRLFDATDHWFHFDHTDVWSLFHSYAFDFTVWEIWGALFYGGRLLIVPQLTARSPEAFHDLLHQEQVTVLNQTPSAFIRLIQAGDAAGEGQKLNLRYVIFGGEALDPQALRPWYRRYSDKKPLLVNMYGITETTVHVTWRALSLGDTTRADSNIGVRIPDLTLYLLDSRLLATATGVPGEIMVGGAGVARGYLNRPGLTAQRFVPNPYAVTPGERLYRSGDLGRFMDQQNPDEPAPVAYTGRADFQVKIRGFRIEPGEIEAVLLAHPAVRDAVVLARRETPGADAYLAAWLVADELLTTTALRQYCSTMLPEYMVPALFMQLDQMPLTAHGKVDRKNLPDPGHERPDLETGYVAPRTPTEETLAAIWADVLNIEKVGIHDTFFELGGDSILSIRVMARARKAGLPMSLELLFGHPTIAQLAPLIGISDQTRVQSRPMELVSDRDRAAFPEDIEDAWPLTMLQKGMLFHSESGGDLYHNLTTFHLRAPFNSGLFEQALSDIMMLHPVLRSAIEVGRYSEPLQLVYRDVKPPLILIDLAGLGSDDIKTQMDLWFEGEKHRHFDQTEPGLFRVTIHLSSADSFYFTLTEHHAIVDGWSVATLLADLFRRYLSLLDSPQSPAPQPLPISFRDHIAAERLILEEEATRAFWLEQMDDFEFTRIPRRREVLHEETNTSGNYNLHLDTGVIEGLEALSRSLGSPLKTVLLAAHFRVLALITAQNDVTTGIVVNGRPESEAGEKVLGLYLNTLPVRIKIERGSWRDLVSRVFEVERRILSHRRYPMAAIRQLFGGESFFETAFNFTDFHVYQDVLAREGLEVLEVRFFAPTDIPLAANFNVDPRTRQLGVSLDFDAALFPMDQIQAVAEFYRITLEAMAFSPDANQRDTFYLNRDDRVRLLETFNATAREFSTPQNLYSMVVASALANPDLNAVSFIQTDGQFSSLKYRDLLHKANRLGHHLVSLGVVPDEPVGVCMERGLDAVIGILGVLAAGGAYVPMDPEFPAERLTFMVQDSGSRLVVVGKAPDHPLNGRAQLVEVYAGSSGPVTLPEVCCHPLNMAYMIYTSGSTGTPKGSMIAHEGIVNQLCWRQRRFNWEAGDAMLQTLSLSFDPSVWQVFWPLTCGGEVVMIPSGAQKEIGWLSGLIRERGIRGTAMVPSMLRLFLENTDFLAARSLKHISCGGEAVPVELVEQFLSHFGENILEVVYGPTEATIDATTWVCESGHGDRIAPIGRAIDNVQVYVLDRALNPVPTEVPGELFIGGAGVGRGYWLRPALTAERFVPNPFGSEAGARLYRTGDVVRYLPGEKPVINFRGRVDHQVKVRGFRIELGELEAVLVTHDRVKDSVALVIKDPRGGHEKVLVAYVESEKSLESSQLRTWLAERVPHYMMPTTLMVLAQFPKLPNGKVNRRALPKPDFEVGRTSYQAPRNPVEEALVSIWQDVLGSRRIGVFDNFFELGGDSILSIQITARARTAGIHLTPKQLFEFQTIAALARIRAEVVPILAEQGAVTGDVVLTPVQRWFFEGGASHHFNQSILLNLPAEINGRQLARALNQLLEHHDALRLRFSQNSQGQWSAGHCPEARTVPLLEISTDDIEPHCTRVQQSFELEKPPHLRAILFQTPQGQQLFLAAHHLVIDGVSWRILLEDLQNILMQDTTAARAILPPKTTSFKQWSEKLQEYVNSAVPEQEALWWRNQPSAPLLPVDAEISPETDLVGSASELKLDLDPETTSRLLLEAGSAFNSRVDDLLLTALVQALAPWCGSSTLAVELESHGREVPEHRVFEGVDLSRTLGWFTLSYPLVLDGSGNLGEALKRIKEKLRSVPAGGLGYGLLKYLHGSLEGTSAGISFNYLGQIDRGEQAGLLSLADGATGPAHDPERPRPFPLEINAFVREGRLQATWTFNPRRHLPETVKKLADNWFEQLTRLVHFCLVPENGGRTPSDFPLARINQQQLDALPLPARNLQDLYPLSPMQQGMLFHSISDTSSGVYHQQLWFGLKGALNQEHLRTAWQTVVNRHTILRTAFLWQGFDTPQQMVLEKITLDWFTQDLSALTEPAALARVRAWIEADRRRGFQFEQAPLMRLALFQSGPQQHELVWSHHHMLLDGWSLPLILSEILTIYQGLGAGSAPLLPDPIPYRNYIQWLGNRDAEAAEAYWFSHLAGISAPTPIPEEKLPDGPAHAETELELDEQLTGQLEAMARSRRLTLNILVQCAWSLLLHRYSGEEDVLFGHTTSGRPPQLDGVETIPGLFINTLPVRVSVTSGLNLSSLLERMMEDSGTRELHGWTPLSKIMSWSDLPSGQDPFASIVVFENYPMDASLKKAGGSISWTVRALEDRTSIPLTLTIRPGARLALRLAYHGRRFSASMAARFLVHLRQILAGLAANPDVRPDRLAYLSGEERRFMLEHWNRTWADYGSARPLHSYFEKKVLEQPAATALLFDDEKSGLSYQQMNQKANRLAHRLLQLGVGPEVQVAVCAERSYDLVIALYAVLKAGGTYVPMDPDYPSDRLAYMLEDARTPVLLTQSHLVERLPEFQSTLLLLDQPLPLGLPDHNPEIHLEPLNSAYTIYTSGSTGKPKGATNSHAGIVNRLLWMQDEYQLDNSDAVLQKTPFSFDVSVWEFFWPLMTGARLVIARPGGHGDPGYLKDLIVKQQITTLHFVPSMLAAFIDFLGSEKLTSWPQRVFSSGEALPADLVTRYHQHLLAGLHNLYGPTEAAVDVTFRQCKPGDTSQPVPIGYPISNTVIHIVDTCFEPTPVGVAGELLIGGINLARGYARRPGLTAEKFIPNPFSVDPGARLYRSGDLARYRGDGEIEYLGRTDHQVKLRGLRIELGEIEACLAACPEVKQNTVLVWEKGAAPRLVAWVVAENPKLAEDSVSQSLRRQMSRSLPEFMIPTAFVYLDQMPLSPNGKLDRRALPGPESETEEHYQAPGNPVEEKLALIWAGVLGREPIGIHDNFFQLGGDSILSLQIVARAREAGLYFAPQAIFESQTIARLALVTETALVMAAEQGPVMGDVPLVPYQSLLFSGNREAQTPHWIALPIPAELEPHSLQTALNAVLLHHDALRLYFPSDQTGQLQLHAEPDCSMILDHRVYQGAEQVLNRWFDQLLIEVTAVFQIDQPPLMRSLLTSWVDGSGQQQHRLFLSVDRLIFDASSWPILVEDLLLASQQLAAGRKISLASKTTAFRDWSLAMKKFAVSQAVTADLAWWKARDFSSPTNLPIARGEKGRLVLRLTAEKTTGLLGQANEAYQTRTEELVLTALVRNASRKGEGLALMLEIPGPLLPADELFQNMDLSRSVGAFNRFYPVHLDSSQEFDQAIKLVKQGLRSVPRQGLSYGLLRFSNPVTASEFSELSLTRFSYLGEGPVQLDESFRHRSPEGPGISENTPEGLCLKVGVEDGQLWLEWSWTDLSGAAVADMANSCLKDLEDLISFCLQPGAGGRVPADYELAHLDQSQVNLLAGDGRNLTDIWPLSPMQHGMLLHSLADEGESGLYLQQVWFGIRGSLNRDALVAAWQYVLDRHPILRARFVWDGLDEPLQLIPARVSPRWLESDISHMDPDSVQQQIWNHLAEDRRLGFDLSVSPLLRLALFKVGPQAWELVWTHHHLLLDGWSMSVLLTELVTAYDKINQQQQLEFGSSYTFRDYLAWLSHQDPGKTEAFWTRYLDGISGATQITEDGAPDQPIHGEAEVLLSSELSSQLEHLARTRKFTLSTLALGAWGLLLHRYSGVSTVLFGQTTSGRPAGLAGVESIPGMFINTLPLRIHFGSNQSISQILEELRAESGDHNANGWVPLTRIIGWSDLPAGQEPFQSIVIFENYPVDKTLKEQEGDLSWSVRNIQERTNLPISLIVLPGDQLRLKLAYQPRRIAASSATRILEHLEILFRGLVQNPDAKPGEIPIMSAVERQQLLYDWNKTTKTWPGKDSLVSLIEQQVSLRPEHQAVVLEDSQDSLTYSQLDEKANRLAHHLRSLGVGPEVHVAICIERSTDLLVALLATLKAGGAYVPLDPGFPADRLAYMMEDAGALVLLTQTRLEGHLRDFQASRVLLDQLDLQSLPQTPLNQMIDPSMPAYTIYTSGSTGRPKGVQVTHGSLLNFLFSMRQAPGMAATDRLLAVTTISFDIAGLELYLPLLCGAGIVLASRESALDGLRLATLIDQQNISFMQATPATWRLLLDSQWAGKNQLVAACGGEALTPQLAGELVGRCRSLWNLYGPTETTIWSTVHQVKAGEAPAGGNAISIGRPLANTSLFILGRDGQPVPAGAAGELLIGGSGLARGYYRRPGLTAERFVPLAFGLDPGARVYRTGDLVRYRADGSLTFLGRIDFQVKLRGYRIELGEIEAALEKQSQVKQAVVNVIDQRLIAWVVLAAEPGDEPMPELLRGLLSQALPEYMIPAAFVFQNSMPLTPNGKVDRKRLPKPELSSSQTFIAPRNPVEVELAALVGDLLGVEKVGVNDSFFELGGHSLLATQFVSRMNKAFELSLPIKVLFEAPTVGRLAEIVIANQVQDVDQDDLARILAEVEGLSDDDLLGLLED